MSIPGEIAAEIVEPQAYSDSTRMHKAFTWLRANAPFERAELDGYDPFWVVSKHADIRAIERQSDLFHNGDRATVLGPTESIEKVKELTGGSPHLVRALVQMDDPDHSAYRALTADWFMPQNLKKLEDRIREIARGFIDRMLATGGECDFARDVAFLYPLHVIMEVIGVPEEDEPRMLKLTQEMFGSQDPDVNRTGALHDSAEEGVMSVQETVMDFMMYFNAISEDRRKNPRNDMASLIANGKINGEPLGHVESMGYYIIAASAGHDTTSNTTAGAMWALAENPDQFKMVQENPALISSMVEESIRWETPVKHFMRTATEDTEFRDREIKKGDWFFLSYPSANRDEDVFEYPFKFKVDRSPNRHLAFGYGPHICLGQHLGRMEMRILWEELLPKLKSVELTGTPKRVAANFVSGPKNVPIKFTLN